MAKLFKYGTVGGLGVIHKTWLFFIAVSVFAYPENLIIIPIAIIILVHNYELNRIWTFKVKRTFSNFYQYALANASTLLIYFISFWILNIFTHYLVASILSVGVSGGINFLLAKRILK